MSRFAEHLRRHMTAKAEARSHRREDDWDEFSDPDDREERGRSRRSERSRSRHGRRRRSSGRSGGRRLVRTMVMALIAVAVIHKLKSRRSSTATA